MLSLLVAKSILGGLNPAAQIFDTRSILFSFFTRLLAGSELRFHVIGVFFGAVQSL
jgi:hypothetical protein